MFQTAYGEFLSSIGAEARVILDRRWEAHARAAGSGDPAGPVDRPECSERTSTAYAGRVRFPKAFWSKSLETGLRGPRLMMGLNRTLRHRRILISCFFMVFRPFA